MIVGSEHVLQLKSHLDVINLFSRSKEYFDHSVAELLQVLLLDGDSQDVVRAARFYRFWKP